MRSDTYQRKMQRYMIHVTVKKGKGQREFTTLFFSLSLDDDDVYPVYFW